MANLKHILVLITIFLTPLLASFLLIYGLWELCGLSENSEEIIKVFFIFVCVFCIFMPCAVCAVFVSYIYFDWAFGAEGESLRFKEVKDGK